LLVLKAFDVKTSQAGDCEDVGAAAVRKNPASPTVAAKRAAVPTPGTAEATPTVAPVPVTTEMNWRSSLWPHTRDPEVIAHGGGVGFGSLETYALPSAFSVSDLSAGNGERSYPEMSSISGPL
jgi:hypothetical protein